MMNIIFAKEPAQAALWDNFVRSHSGSHFEQLYGWKYIFEDVYNSTTCYLMALDNETVLGVLPLVYVKKSLISGNYLTSLPGGLIASTEESAGLLITRAIEITKKYNAEYLKLRDGNIQWPHGSLRTTVEYTYVIDPCPQDPQVIWQAVKANARTPVRRAQDEGLITAWGLDNFESFYRVYATNMRDLGSPATPKILFQHAINQFPGKIDLLTAKYKNKIIGGMLFFYHQGKIYNPIASSLRTYFKLQPNDLLYWEALKHSCEEAFSAFDMGRSEENSGNAKFKIKWTAQPRELFYQYFLNTAKDIPDTRGGRIYKTGSRIWKHLPLFIANSLSPFIRRSVPDEI